MDLGDPLPNDLTRRFDMLATVLYLNIKAFNV